MSKIIYMLKIYTEQNINYKLKHFKFLKLLLNAKWYGWYHKNVEEYNPGKKRRILVIFDDMIAYMLSNEKLNSVVTVLFIRDSKPNAFLVFMTHQKY